MLEATAGLESHCEYSWISRKNVSMDLHMEHLNRECKASISGLGANITEQTVKRVGKCLGETIRNFDSQTDVHRESGYHTTRSEEKDITLLKQLNHTEVFKEKKPQKHTLFKDETKSHDQVGYETINGSINS